MDPNLEKIEKGLRFCFETANCDGCPYEIECRKISFKTPENHCPILDDVLALLKEQQDLKQKMWNALYAEEDKLEEKYVGTKEHNSWFLIYRQWLQKGFEIAIKVIAEQDGM